ncbi:MAG: VCBS repeat-containing protein, partial [Muribaculaceae bacterium]|nr:VCBS repeat-containing protein [Muribaculaceae bacterium]
LINYLKTKGLRGEEATQPLASPRFAAFEKAGEMQRLSNGSGAWGDYNNDGYLDLIAIGCNINDGWKDVAYLYENNGDGSFTRHDNPISGARESAVAWIDFDNDGNLDIVTCGARSGNRANAATRLFRNTGPQGGYAFEQVQSTGMEGISNESEKCYHYIAVADFDNDGWQDILITGQNSSGARRTSLYRNEAGSGRFTLMDKALDGERCLRPLSSGCVSFADMNRDGYQDILVSGYGDKFSTYPQQTGTYYIYTNNGDGTFSETGSGDEWVTFLGTCVWADVNADGYADFIITGKHRNASNQDINQGKFYINNGDGSFHLVRSAEANIEGVNTAGVDFADVNNDGLLDMVIAGNGTTSNGRTWIYINEGNVRFAPDAVTVNKLRNATVALGDYDNDGRVDLFQCGYRDGSGAGSTSEIWHNVSAYGANEAPGVPGSLQAIVDGTKVKFSWTAPADDTTPAEALRYNLYVRDADSGSTAMVVPADIATGRLKTGEMTQALFTTSYEMNLPVADKNYEWGVQAIDTAKAAGKFATGTFATSGISDVEADVEAGEAKYYNVSGIEVKNPDSGIFIVKNGNSATKVVR